MFPAFLSPPFHDINFQFRMCVCTAFNVLIDSAPKNILTVLLFLIQLQEMTNQLCIQKVYILLS